MKKQISAIEMVIVVAMALVALIVVFAASRQLAAPDLPSIQSSSAIASRDKDVEMGEATAVSLAGSEVQYSAVVVNPATGQAEALQYSAPRLRNLETEAGLAGSEGKALYSTVVLNPVTGQAEAVQYAAPRLRSLETAAAPEAGFAGSMGEGRYSAVVFNPATGVEVIEWKAPRVSSLSSGTAVEGSATYSAVVVNPTSGAELVEWVALRLSSAKTAAPASSSGEGRYSTVVVDSVTGRAEIIEWKAPQAK